MDKLIFVLPGLTLFLFFVAVFIKGNTVQSCLLFMLAALPLMDLKITYEAWGGFKVFDFICLYCMVFLLKDFIRIYPLKRNDLYLGLFLLLSITILFGGLNSEFPDRTWLKYVRVLPIFIFGRFFINECFRDPSFRLRALKALKGSYLMALAFLAVQLVVGLQFTYYPSLNPNTVDPVFNMVRFPGIFYDSQGHGQFLAMGSFLFLYTEKNAGRKTVLFNTAVFVLAIGAIAVAGSRAALGGFAAGLLLVFFMAARQYRVYGGAILLAGAIAYLVVSPSTTVTDRATDLPGDYLFRKGIWTEAWNISGENPLLGIGIGNYQNYVIRHVQDQYLEITEGELLYFDQPENGYLKILVELGYIGFVIFMLFLILPLFSGLKRYFNKNTDTHISIFMAALISWMVAFFTVYSIADYRLLIMVASLVVLIYTYPPKEKPDHVAAY